MSEELTNQENREMPGPVTTEVISAKKEGKISKLKKWYRQLSRINKFFVVLIGILTAGIGLYSAYAKLKYDENSDKNTKEDNVAKQIDNYKNKPHFDIRYYSFDTKGYTNSVINGNSEIDFTQKFIKNKVFEEYWKSDLSYELMDIDAMSLYSLSLLNSGDVPANDVNLLVKKVSLKEGFSKPTSEFLNSISKDDFYSPLISKTEFEKISLGDIVKKEGVFLPTMVVFHKNLPDANVITDSATGKEIILPVKLYFTYPYNHLADSVDIRPMLNYDIIINLYVRGKG